MEQGRVIYLGKDVPALRTSDGSIYVADQDGRLRQVEDEEGTFVVVYPKKE